MKTFCITHAEYNDLVALANRSRWGWPATFSSNRHGEIWKYNGPGYTPPSDREYIQGISKIIDAIAAANIETRSEGGRFFINEQGAFFKDSEGDEIPFLIFCFPRG